MQEPSNQTFKCDYWVKYRSNGSLNNFTVFLYFVAMMDCT